MLYGSKYWTLNALNRSPKKNKNLGLLITVSMIVILTTLSLASPAFSNIGLSNVARRTIQPSVPNLPKLGIDCGLGAKEAVVNGTGFPVAPSENGVFQISSSCTWIGDVGNYTTMAPSDKTTEPLVSDQDETFSTVSPQIGGGFTADVVYIQNATSAMNGFDIFVSWNPNILHAVMFDLVGTNWAALSPFNAVQTIDNAAGQAHLLQLVFASYGSNFIRFRLRFDVVGIWNTWLTISDGSQCGILNPGPVVHQIIQGSFDSESYSDPAHTLNWSGGFTFSLDPSGPGPLITFTSTIACTGCTGTLTYGWNFNTTNTDLFSSQISGNPAIIAAPNGNASIFVSRVTLRVLDSATPTPHNVTVVERPFAAAIRGRSNLATETSGTWSGFWLGGNAKYSVKWRFCPAPAPGTNTAVCAKPAPSITSQRSQNNTQILSGASPGYHFSGVYNVSLTVTDSGLGLVPPSAIQAYGRVNVTGGTPVFTVLTVVNTQNATVGFPVKVTSSITYSNAYPSGLGFRSVLFSYTIKWGDGTSSVVTNTGFISPYPASASHNYTVAGSYPITVVAQDGETPQIGESSFASVSVASVVAGDFSLSTTSPVTGQSVTFTAAISGGVPPYTYFWDYGDGSTDTGASTAHAFAKSGNYTVTVTVTDSGGRKFYKTHVETVSQASVVPPPPLDNSTLIYSGVAAVVIAAVAGLLFLRRRRARRAPLT